MIWATGFRPDHSWLHIPALDRKGRLRHEGGIVDVPGLYALGLNFMRRRPGRNACEGWCEVGQALARARPRDATWRGPRVGF